MDLSVLDNKNINIQKNECITTGKKNILIITYGQFNSNDYLYEFLLDEKRESLNIYADRTLFLDNPVIIGDVFTGRIDKILKNNELIVNIGAYGMAYISSDIDKLQYFNKISKKQGPHQGDEVVIEIKTDKQKTKYPIGQPYISDIPKGALLFQKIKNGQMHYIRNIFNNISTLEKIVTDDKNIYDKLIETYGGSTELKIEFYNDNDFTLYKLYSLSSKISEAVSRSVKLKSGAEIIIDHTEAFEIIDVNSGRSSRKSPSNSEEYFMQINMEALKEAAKQIRIRNLSGIILIDLINLKDGQKYNYLLNCMKDLSKKDIIPTNIIDITPLGIMEITRKKVDTSLKQLLTYND